MKIIVKKIIIPEQTKILISKENIKITGIKGEIEMKIPSWISTERINQKTILLKQNQKLNRKNLKKYQSLIGTIYRKIIQNLYSTNTGYYLIIKITGTGFKVYQQQNKLIFKLGYSHVIIYTLSRDIKCHTIKNKIILLYGIQKEKIKQAFNNISKLKKINIYKGTGITKYQQKLILKEGKKKNT